MAAVRLSIWNSDGDRRLTGPHGTPVIEVDGGAAAAPQTLIGAVRGQLGLDVALLRVAAEDAADVEVLGDGIPAAWGWTPDTAVPAVADREVWQRPGWLAGVARQVRAAGFAPVGPLEQIRHSTITGLVRIPIGAGWVWFKAGPAIFAAEGHLSATVAAFAGRAVPQVLAYGRQWLLMSEFPAAAADPATGEYVTKLAEIQIASLSHVDGLRQAGFPQRPLSYVAQQVRKLAGRADLLRDTDRQDRLAAALPALDGLCDAVDGLGFPLALVHGDLNVENVRWTEAGWFLYDWTDACLSHPFVDVGLALSESGSPQRTAAAYGALWEKVMPAAAVAQAIQAAPVLTAAFQAANYQSILDGVDGDAGDESNGEQMRGLLHLWVDRLAAIR